MTAVLTELGRLFRRFLKKTKNQGFVLIVSILTLTALLMTGSYLLSLTNSENKISVVQSLATKNYYLAETGINEMIWKIQNNQATKNAFIAGTLSSANNISRTNIFGETKFFTLEEGNATTFFGSLIQNSRKFLAQLVGTSSSNTILGKVLIQGTMSFSGDGFDFTPKESLKRQLILEKLKN